VGRKFEEEKICFSLNNSQTSYTTKFKAFSSQFVTENSNSAWKYQIGKATD